MGVKTKAGLSVTGVNPRRLVTGIRSPFLFACTGLLHRRCGRLRGLRLRKLCQDWGLEILFKNKRQEIRHTQEKHVHVCIILPEYSLRREAYMAGIKTIYRVCVKV
jgi:hypothetical protein